MSRGIDNCHPRDLDGGDGLDRPSPSREPVSVEERCEVAADHGAEGDQGLDPDNDGKTTNIGIPLSGPSRGLPHLLVDLAAEPDGRGSRG